MDDAVEAELTVVDDDAAAADETLSDALGCGVPSLWLAWLANAALGAVEESPEGAAAELEGSALERTVEA